MKSFYCLIISLSIHLCGYAILPTQFHFRHYNIENGVSSNNISTLFQDQKGYIWIGTENGLNRFDGNQFTLYQKNNPLYSNFHANSINTICETTDKELWLGTDNGVFIYNQVKDTFTPFSNKQVTKPLSLHGLHILFKIKLEIYGLPHTNKVSFYLTHKPINSPSLKYHKTTIL